MRLSFPTATGYNPTNIAAAFDAIRRALLGAVSAEEAAPYIHLQSPNGKIWRVTVSDTGEVTTTQVGVA